MINRSFSTLILILSLAATVPLSTHTTLAAPQAAGSQPVPHKVVAYYFHTNTRCSTCRKIEAYSREAIENGFPDELRDGRLEWRVINYELPDNRHFLQEYKLVTKSLILANVVNGKQTRWTNLKLVWQLTGKKEAFLNYVRGEVQSYLSKE